MTDKSSSPSATHRSSHLLAMDRMIESVQAEIAENDPGNHATIAALNGELKGLLAGRLLLELAFVPSETPQKPDVGPWKIVMEMAGVTLYSEDFEHDVAISITGDFADNAQRLAYAEDIAKRLSAKTGTPAVEIALRREFDKELAAIETTRSAIREKQCPADTGKGWPCVCGAYHPSECKR